MNRKSIFCLCVPIATGLLLFVACNNQPSTGNASAPIGLSTVSHLPQDVDSICGISVDSFNVWFRSGTATENGFVTPANSVTFIHNDNCDFYHWAERMFLWITSRTGQNGSGEHVLESPLFYTVESDDTTGGLKLVKHEPGKTISAVSVLRKSGPNRLPVFSDKNGRLFEVVFHKPGEKASISNGKALIKTTGLVHPERVLHVFKTAAGTQVFDSNGNQVDTELDQATGDALIAQNGSLVYYITMVNDMYAFYRSAVKKGYMPDVTFPTTATERDSIVEYARILGYPPPADLNTLAIEIKTSWVRADILRDSAGYVTMDAEIPTYAEPNDETWIRNGKKKVRLALVGIHIVGSVSGHPEMIWSTFEHVGNTPDSAYRYLTSNGSTRIVPADTGRWLFSSSTGAPFNVTHIKVTDRGDSLIWVSPHAISPSNTMRQYPFGVVYGRRPNQQDSDTTDAVSNSELIGINNDVINNIPGNDVRKNYHFIGATWTQGGVAPNGYVYNSPDTVQPGVSIGASALANSTMETYFQSTSTSCLYCHSFRSQLTPDALSHIFQFIRPLGPVPRK